jgi:glutamine cyclotransferase
MKLVLIALLIPLIASCRGPEMLRGRVTAKIPHDPECYTQGLEFRGSRLFESSGRYGSSTIREVDPASGAVLRRRPLARHVFAEGITLLGDELWILTWQENTAYVFNPETFEFLRSYKYTGEGWGLANDGTRLIMSDGTHVLKFINPSDFSIVRTIEVKDRGRKIDQLNELEYADGAIYANVFMQDRIARISPDDGRVTAWIALEGLRDRLPQPHKAEVMNGIAHNPANGRLLVTGKNWPRMFEIELTRDVE